MGKFKVSREIVKIENLKIKMCVVIEEGEQFSSFFDYSINSNIKGVSISSDNFISLEFKVGKDWSESHSINLRNLDLAKLDILLKQVYDLIFEVDTYKQTKGGKLILKEELDGRNWIVDCSSGDYIKIKLDVLVDETGKNWEGITITLNDETCSTSLTVDMLKCLIRVITKIDLYMYSQPLINFYIEYTNRKIGATRREKKYAKSLFDCTLVKDPLDLNIGGEEKHEKLN